MKKTFTILLSAIILVASFGATGVFAGSFSDFPSNGSPVYSVPYGKYFFKIVKSSIVSSDPDNPTYLFNNLCAYVSDQWGNYKVGYYDGMSYHYYAQYPNDRTLYFATNSLTGITCLGNTQSTVQFGDDYGSQLTSVSSDLTPEVLGVILNNDDEFLDSGITGEWVNFSIKPGYAFVIEGECEILERSYYINNSWSFFGTNNAHRTNGSSERISAIGNIRDGFSVDYGLTRDQLIQWEAQNPNLVGDASIYEFYNNDLISLSSGSAFFISYPLYDGVQTTLEGLRSRENSVDFIGSVYLNYFTRPTFRYVALKSNIDANNKDVAFYNTLQPSITDSSGDVTETPDGTTISPGDIPSGGGDSSTPPLDEDNSLLGTISKFVNDIKRLLSTAVESINTLVSEGSQFMRSVAQMFTWLPEQLTSLLIAAFTILVVVGVLKVLWR